MRDSGEVPEINDENTDYKALISIINDDNSPLEQYGNNFSYYMQSLKEKYEDKNFKQLLNHKDSNGTTLLMRAVEKENFRMISALYDDYYVDPSIQNNDRKTALDIANSSKNPYLLEMMTEIDEHYKDRQLLERYDYICEFIENHPDKSDLSVPDSYVNNIREEMRQYECAIGYSIMKDPAYLDTNPKINYDLSVLKEMLKQSKKIKKSAKDPSTNEEFTRENIVIDKEKKQQSIVFINEKYEQVKKIQTTEQAAEANETQRSPKTPLLPIIATNKTNRAGDDSKLPASSI